MQIRKSKKTTPQPAAETHRSAEDRIARAAGTEQFQHRDPLYHVTESFQQTFDKMGRKHAQDAVGGFSAEERSQEESEQAKEQTGKQEKKPPQSGEQAQKTPQSGDRASEKRRAGDQMLWTGNVPSALTRFSETAFQRGAMSASVLNGTGKMMLVSCLKRTVGQSGPKRIQQQTVIGTGSQIRNIPGRSADQMVFNRTVAKSAIGIVVNALRDARRVVDSMTAMARGTGELHSENSATLQTMYPFLDNSRDLALEAEYREKLARCTDEREKPVLQNALVQVLSLKAKKAQMKAEFINKLRLVSDRATETLADLEAPGTLDEIVSAVWGDREPDLPENPEEGADGNGNAPDGSKDGTDPTDREGKGRRPTKTKR